MTVHSSFSQSDVNHLVFLANRDPYALASKLEIHYQSDDRSQVLAICLNAIKTISGVDYKAKKVTESPRELEEKSNEVREAVNDTFFLLEDDKDPGSPSESELH